jgi:DNA-binding HxlR family transcriptional regulator
MLIQHLRELERDEVVHREVHHAVPPKVEYSLTEIGIPLIDALRPLSAWGCQHKTRLEAIRNTPAPAAGTTTSASPASAQPSRIGRNGTR